MDFNSKYQIVPANYEDDRVIEANVSIAADAWERYIIYNEITIGIETVFLEYDWHKFNDFRHKIDNRDLYFLAHLHASKILTIDYCENYDEVYFKFHDDGFFFYDVRTDSECGTLEFSVKLIELNI